MIYHTIYVKVIEKSFRNGGAFRSPNTWMSGDFASRKLTLYYMEMILLGLRKPRLALRGLCLGLADVFHRKFFSKVLSFLS